MCAQERKPEERLGPSLRNVAKAFLLLACVAFSEVSGAVSVALKNATATFSQDPLGGCPCPPSQAIDGSFFPGEPSQGSVNGWAIDHFPNNNPQQEFTTS